MHALFRPGSIASARRMAALGFALLALAIVASLRLGPLHSQSGSVWILCADFGVACAAGLAGLLFGGVERFAAQFTWFRVWMAMLVALPLTLFFLPAAVAWILGFESTREKGGA